MRNNLPVLLLPLFLLSTPSSSQTCKTSCGSLPIHYPFGAAAGCGSPTFHPHVACDGTTNTLTFTTKSGSYTIQAIDYTNQIIYLNDPSMSTCSTTTPSSGFSLYYDAPFAFTDADIFALLDCSTAPSSPLYSTNTTPLCDTSNAPICSLLYSCTAVSELDAPISTCCIYAPASLGPAFELNLTKLQCSSYAGIYSFNGAETNPEGWKFGISLKYRFSVDDGYPKACANCEKSNGVCGYAVGSNSFSCNCANGMNTSTTCSMTAPSWSGGDKSPAANLWSWFVALSSWWVTARKLPQP